MMFVTTPAMFYVLRFLLGVFEAGFYPGVILYLTYWYPTERRAKAFGLFMSASALAGVLGGPLAGTIMTGLAGANGWAGWQWVFLLEGIPSMIAGHRHAALPHRQARAGALADRGREAPDPRGPRARPGSARLARAPDPGRAARPQGLAVHRDLLLHHPGQLDADLLRSDHRQGSRVHQSGHGRLDHGRRLPLRRRGMILNGRSSDHHVESRYHCGLAALTGAVAMALLGFLVPSVPYLALVALDAGDRRHDERDPGVLADAEPVPGGLGRGCGYRADQLRRQPRRVRRALRDGRDQGHDGFDVARACGWSPRSRRSPSS